MTAEEQRWSGHVAAKAVLHSAPVVVQGDEDDVWTALANVPVRVWFCPDREAHGQRPGKTVEWRDGVAHCLHPGCARTSDR